MGVSSALGSSALLPAGLGFRNKLINGDFRINQRGFSSTTTSGAYGLDRWYFQTNTGTGTYSRQTFTTGSPAASGFESEAFARVVSVSQTGSFAFLVFSQKIEDVRNCAGATVSISFYAKAASGNPKVAVELEQNFGSGGSPSATVTNYVGQVTLSTSWQLHTLVFNLPSIAGKTIGTTANTSSLVLNLWCSAGTDFNARTGSLGVQNNTFDFWGVQVEQNYQPTPFEQRPIGVELALCQRYYQHWVTGTTGGNQIGFGNGFNATSIYPVVEFRQQMRGAPNALTWSGLRVNDVTTSINATAVALEQIGVDGVRLQVTVASGGVQYRGYALEAGSAGSFLGISAEL